ncbi:phosphonate ABC transporter ATP-binding protein [Crocosphaera chwakensis]|uniref:ABC phosphate/phosphonate transport system ATPase n=1 Tax=Crocosphaera chwakensis CCY0110 TaxID=391612 RepID=A3IUM6_9CHRO|nr:phosphonate ABC transporter ATP-binding protein [Crocosphaera chwakensis]EAZ89818.1 ABC phosphate/phosphonate transport system ATPase [Crocosphaera chwakensis CCY0110]
MTTIEFKGVTKTFNNGFRAIQRTDLTINPGEFTVILGSSGAGKSTLLRMVNGLETPSQGEIFIDQRKLTPQNLRHIRAKVGMIFQQFNLVNRLNVMTNVLIGRSYYRRWWESLFYLFTKQDYKLAHWALERVELTDKVWQRASNLSGGQQQRVAIARVLAQKPQIIIADEPVASLDPATSLEILGLLSKICKEDGVTVLASLHQVNLAMQFADRIIGIKQGKVIFDDQPVNLLNNSLLETIYDKKEHEKIAVA